MDARHRRRGLLRRICTTGLPIGVGHHANVQDADQVDHFGRLKLLGKVDIVHLAVSSVVAGTDEP